MKMWGSVRRDGRSWIKSQYLAARCFGVRVSSGHIEGGGKMINKLVF